MSNTITSRQRTGILATMCLALVAVVASVAGLNVALNELAVELGASSSQILWIVNAYTLTMAALLLPIGEWGDRFGRRRMLLVGLAIFGGANLAAVTVVDGAQAMIALRAVAGLGAAMIMPATLSTLTAVFPEEERGRAVGIWAGFAGAGGILGLFSSAVLIDYTTWQWLFALPVVAAVLAAIATIALVPETRHEHAPRFDLLGAALSVLAVGGIVMGVEEGPHLGWTDPVVLLGLIGGAVALAGFVAAQLRTEHPLLDVRIFSDRALSVSAFSLAILFALMLGSFLVVIQLLQAVLGYSAVTAAAGLLPMAAAMMGLSPVAPRIADRFGLTNVLTVGAVAMAVAFGWLAVADASYLGIMPPLVLLGAAMGLSMSPATTAITEALPAERQGLASALNDTVREAGSALGIALIGSTLASGYGDSITSTTDTLPEELAEPVGEGIGQALAVAGQLGPEGVTIAQAAQTAFLDGWTLAMFVAAAASVVSAVGIRQIGRIRPDTIGPETTDSDLVGPNTVRTSDVLIRSYLMHSRRLQLHYCP
ncbi:MAG: DHA2 family efflux MFS transporter permease subunit [Actinomycetota bacterium]